MPSGGHGGMYGRFGQHEPRMGDSGVFHDLPVKGIQRPEISRVP